MSEIATAFPPFPERPTQFNLPTRRVDAFKLADVLSRSNPGKRIKIPFSMVTESNVGCNTYCEGDLLYSTDPLPDGGPVALKSQSFQSGIFDDNLLTHYFSNRVAVLEGDQPGSFKPLSRPFSGETEQLGILISRPGVMPPDDRGFGEVVTVRMKLLSRAKTTFLRFQPVLIPQYESVYIDIPWRLDDKFEEIPREIESLFPAPRIARDRPSKPFPMPDRDKGRVNDFERDAIL